MALITGSAEQGYLPALEKLVSMYNNGEGVERDYLKAVVWQDKLVKRRRKNYEASPNEETAICLLSDLRDLGDAYTALGKLSPAQETYEEMRRCSEAFAKQYTDKCFVRNQPVSYCMLGTIAENTGKLNKAEEWYRKGLAVFKSLANETRSVESLLDLSVCYHKLGEISKARSNLSEAEEWYRKSLVIAEPLAKATNTVVSRRNLSLSYVRLGDIFKAGGKLNEAEEWYRKGLAITESLADETNTVDSRCILSFCYNRPELFTPVPDNRLNTEKTQIKMKNGLSPKR